MVWQRLGYILAMVYIWQCYDRGILVCDNAWPCFDHDTWQRLTVFWQCYVTMFDPVMTVVFDNVLTINYRARFNHGQTWSASSSKYVWSWLKTMVWTCFYYDQSCFDNEHFDWVSILNRFFEDRVFINIHNSALGCMYYVHRQVVGRFYETIFTSYRQGPHSI